MVEAFQRAPAAAAVYGHGHAVDAAGRSAGEAFRAPVRFDLRRMRRVCDTLAQPSVFLRRAAVLEVGGLDEGLHWSMDWDLYLRLGSRFAFVPVDRELAVWRDHPESKTRSGAWRRFRELARVARRHTGQRFPPAYFTYLAQTVEYLALARARRAEPRLARAARALQGRIWKRTMQWYPDGWVGPRLDLELAREPGRLRLSGELPHRPELCPGQRLTVCEGGRIVARLALDPGRFEHTFEPAPGDGSGAPRAPGPPQLRAGPPVRGAGRSAPRLPARRGRLDRGRGGRARLRNRRALRQLPAAAPARRSQSAEILEGRSSNSFSAQAGQRPWVNSASECETR